MASAQYNLYLKSPEWFEKRNAVLQRDQYKCRNCDSKKNIQVHHKTYANVYNERLTDLVTLCDECHKKYHAEEKVHLLLHVEDQFLTDRFIENAFRHPLFHGVSEKNKELFRKFNKKNPFIYVLFAYYCGVQRRDNDKGSAKQIIERNRHQFDKHSYGKLKINNDLTSLYARILVIKKESYYSFFQFRVSPGQKPSEALLEYHKFMKELYDPKKS